MLFAVSQCAVTARMKISSFAGSMRFRIAEISFMGLLGVPRKSNELRVKRLDGTTKGARMIRRGMEGIC